MEVVRKRPRCTSARPERWDSITGTKSSQLVDEALAGHADKIDVTIHIDNSVTAIDNGRGIPVDNMDIDGEKFPPLVVTKLHAGGKLTVFHKVSGGLHGVGSCVNALMKTRTPKLARRIHPGQSYSGEPTSKLKKTGAVS